MYLFVSVVPKVSFVSIVSIVSIVSEVSEVSVKSKYFYISIYFNQLLSVSAFAFVSNL